MTLVQLEADRYEPVVYITLTMRKPDYLANIATRLKRSLRAQRINEDVKWVRPLDRRLTRLFGWCVVWADHEHLAKAVAGDDKGELNQ